VFAGVVVENKSMETVLKDYRSEFVMNLRAELLLISQ
jgi:hypothetical protein